MASYKTMYLKMFNAVTDIEQQLQQIAATLRLVQQECEEMYMNTDNRLISLPANDTSQDK